MSSSLISRRALIIIGAAGTFLGLLPTDASAAILSLIRREEDPILIAALPPSKDPVGMDVAELGSDSDETRFVKSNFIDDWESRYPAPTRSPVPPNDPIANYLKSLDYKVPRYVRGGFCFTSTPSRPRGLGSARKRGIVGVRKCRTRLRQRRKK